MLKLVGNRGAKECYNIYDSVLEVFLSLGQESVAPKRRAETIEEILRGLSSQLAEKEDEVLCSDVREKLFGSVEFSRRDLAMLNIMRGRDSGVPDYNTVRKIFGLPKIKSLEEINPKKFKENPELLEKLEELYGDDLDSIDLYVGGMLETGDDPGPLFSAIMVEQFARIRDSDRFWFENEGVFTKQEIEEIRKITLWDVIVNATKIQPDEVQRNVFFWHHDDPCPQPIQLNASDLIPCDVPVQEDSFEVRVDSITLTIRYYLFYRVFDGLTLFLLCCHFPHFF